jgi:TonB family protein
MKLVPAGFLVLWLCLVADAPLSAQTGASAPLPTDPVAFMILVHDKNGLNSADVKPWHIRGSYTIYDKNAKPADKGVYEEWWVAPDRYVRSFAGSKFQQTEYATDKGLFRRGDQRWAGSDYANIRADLVEPILEPELLKEFQPKLRDVAVGKAKLPCVQLSHEIPPNIFVSDGFFPQSCFEPAIPALRINSQGSQRVLYDRLALFQGHYLARELHAYLGRDPRFDLNVDTIEILKLIPEGLATVPPDAIAVDITPPIKFSSGIGATRKIQGGNPEYPELAKQQHVSGAVVMRVTIGRDGHVKAIKVKSGPFRLQQAATDAVGTWVYVPFRVLGQPVEIETEITVNFNFG